jgi:hypothetical protein
VKALKAVVIGLCCLVAGCGVIGFLESEGLPTNKQIFTMYHQTTLKQSTSAEVLARFGVPKDTLLSQSKSVVALYGVRKGGKKIWFNMVTFDENELLAKRKYVLLSDATPKQLFIQPWEGLDFGCQMVLPKEVLDEPYANENARRIAILKKVESDTRKDTGEVGTDNEMLSLCGMMVGQGIDTLLTKLDGSPAQAVRFGEPNGIEFEHTSFDKGRLRMVIDNDIVTVRMQLGSFGKRGKAGFAGLGTMEE